MIGAVSSASSGRCATIAASSVEPSGRGSTRSPTFRARAARRSRSLMRRTSSSSAEMNTHRQPVLGELADELLDLGLGADVDAPGRFVEDEQPRREREPAREQHLLLVAAGERPASAFRVGGLDAEGLRCSSSASLSCRAAGSRRTSPASACSASTMFSRDGESPMMPSVAVLGRSRRSLARAPTRGCGGGLALPSTSTRAVVGPVDTGQQPASSVVPSRAGRRRRRSRPRRPQVDGSIAPGAPSPRAARNGPPVRARPSRSGPRREPSQVARLLADHLLDEVDPRAVRA